MGGPPEIRILMVCMGNICRSPVAEGVLRNRLREEGLSGRVFVDSAGTHFYHVGEPPDPRAQASARQRGYDISDLRARQLSPEDFHTFDYLLVMDYKNLRAVESLRPCGESKAHVALLLSYAEGAQHEEVPDPYYGGEEGFQHVLDLVESAVEGLLKDVKTRLS
jgi:protein-tyrosine phosphatase